MRYRRIRDIVIELTSLLDVVMILIFYVMIQNSQLVSELQEKNSDMEDKLEKYAGIEKELKNAEEGESDLGILLTKLHGQESQLNAYKYMDDIVIVYNVGLENYDDNNFRRLTYGRKPDENCKTYDVKQGDDDKWQEAINYLSYDLGQYVKDELDENEEDKYIFLVFSFDDSKVYNKDYLSVEKILMGCVSDYDSDKVRYRLNKLEGE